MTFVGSDPDALDQAAKDLQRLADTLSRAKDDVTRLFATAWWQGGAADRARDRWRRADLPSLVHTIELLREAALCLRQNAKDQRIVSRSDDNPTVFLFKRGAHLVDSVWDSYLEDRRLHAKFDAWARRPGYQALLAVQGSGAAAQLGWWRSLSLEQQSALLRGYPGQLLSLKGIPADVRSDANERYLDTLDSDTSTRDVVASEEFDVDGGLLKGGIKLDVEAAKMGDGTYRLTIGADGSLARSLSAEESDTSLSLGGEVGIAQTYRFNTHAEMMDFLDGLGQACAGGGGIELVDLFPENDVIDYLATQRANLETTKIHGEVQGKFASSDDVFKGSAEGAIGASYDTASGERSLYFDVAGNIDTDSIVSFGASGSSGAEVVFSSDNAPKELVLSGSLEGRAGVDLLKPFTATVPEDVRKDINAEISRGVQTEGAFQATVDLTDPRAAEAARAFLDGRSTPAQYAELLDLAEVKVSLDKIDESVDSATFGPVSHEETFSVTDHKLMFFKPPDGNFIRYSTDAKWR